MKTTWEIHKQTNDRGIANNNNNKRKKTIDSHVMELLLLLLVGFSSPLLSSHGVDSILSFCIANDNLLDHHLAIYLSIYLSPFCYWATRVEEKQGGVL
jgi:hypothetical protein